jgi:hypothetical protein
MRALAKPFQKAKASELSLHFTVEAYLKRAWPAHLRYTHFPAGELRDLGTARKLAQMGLKRGWPDFIFVMPNGQFAGLELKAPGGKLSDDQAALRADLMACGAGYATARSPEEVETIITRWLDAYGLKPRATITRRAA